MLAGAPPYKANPVISSRRSAQENENRCTAIVGAIFSGPGYAGENFFFLGHFRI
jgi:hypothetical protein